MASKTWLRVLSEARYRILASVLAAALIVFVYGIVQSLPIRVERLEVPCPGLPDTADGLIILQTSDLHADPTLKMAKRAAAVLQTLSANLLIMTGDFRFASAGSVPAAVEGARILARAVQSRMPVYAVRGNNDFPPVMAGVPRAGIKVLNNTAVPIARGLWLVGWNPYDRKHPALESLLGTIPSGDAFILAAHSPDVIQQPGSSRAKLILTGHTHGGQIRLPWVRPPVLMTHISGRYSSGLYRFGDGFLYINRGLGTTYVPVRVYSPPEISVITLTAAR